MIFVFGSNLQGVHGAGAAKYARLHHGANYGQGVGHHGNSYALPTMRIIGSQFTPLALEAVRYYVDSFIEYARLLSYSKFQVTRVGCGLAGFKDEEIAPLFENAGPNCYFDQAWEPYLPEKNFWGSF